MTLEHMGFHENYRGRHDAESKKTQNVMRKLDSVLENQNRFAAQRFQLLDIGYRRQDRSLEIEKILVFSI